MKRRKRSNLLNILYYYFQSRIANSNNNNLNVLSKLRKQILELIVNYDVM